MNQSDVIIKTYFDHVSDYIIHWFLIKLIGSSFKTTSKPRYFKHSHLHSINLEKKMKIRTHNLIIKMFSNLIYFEIAIGP